MTGQIEFALKYSVRGKKQNRIHIKENSQNHVWNKYNKVKVLCSIMRNSIPKIDHLIVFLRKEAK